MSSFFALVFLAAVVVAIVFLRKSSKLKKGGEDNAQAKKIGLISIGVAVIAFIVVGATAPATETEDGITSEEPITEAVVNSTEEKNDESDAPTEESTDNEQSIDDVIEINADELGEYGQELVLNENTDMPDNTIGYFVPTGKYEVTNKGDYPTQVNIYKNEKHVTEEGWEEWADGNVVLIKVGESAEIEVHDGYFVNVDAPAHIELKAID